MSVVAEWMVRDSMGQSSATSKTRRPAPNETEVPPSSALFRWGVQLVTVVAPGVAAEQQRSRYHVFVAQGGEAKPLFRTGVLACLVGLPIYLVLIFVAAAIWKST
jgi:hypothetical protein